MKLINLCPHPITVHVEGELKPRQIAPEAMPARVETNSVQVGTVDGVPLYQTRYGQVLNLPDPQPDTTYIVSYVVLTAPVLRDRSDLCAPGTGPADNCVRDSSGRVVGVTRLVKL